MAVGEGGALPGSACLPVRRLTDAAVCLRVLGNRWRDKKSLGNRADFYRLDEH